MKVSMFVLASLVLFWAAMLLAAATNPGYSHVRDYLSTLAAHGAEHAWLGVLAIAAAAAGIGFAAFLLRPLSRVAAVASAASGAGLFVVAFTRLNCPNGAARCGLGGRFDVAGFSEVTHSLALAISATLLVGAMASTGIALLRLGWIASGVATLVAAAATATSFAGTGGTSPGWIERIGVVVATGWVAAIAIADIVRTCGVASQRGARMPGARVRRRSR
jgi:hypothetical protein